MKIFIVNILTLIINLSLLLIISYKLNKLSSLKQDYFLAQKNIEELLNETTYLSNTFLDNLETKITEGKTLLASLAAKEDSLKQAVKQAVKQGAAIVAAETGIKEELLDPVSKEMVKLFKQGKTIVEIAEKMNTTQGEVALRLNLGKKLKGKN